jgi:hypothetical protein
MKKEIDETMKKPENLSAGSNWTRRCCSSRYRHYLRSLTLPASEVTFVFERSSALG